MIKRKDFLPEFEPPRKKHVSGHELLVKSLLKTQSNTDTNLERELKRDKCFLQSIDYDIRTSCGAGICSLKQLQTDQKQLEEHNRLLNYGLNDNDIKLYHTYKDGGMALVYANNTNHECNLLEQKINSILEIIAHNKCTPEDYVTQGLVLAPPMEDVNILNNKINDEILTNDNPVNIKQIRRKARKTANRLLHLLSNQVITNKVITTNCCNAKSLWDIKDYKEVVKENTQLHLHPVTYTCKEQTLYTIRNGEITKIKEEDEAKSAEFQITGQLSLENIKKLPQFSNYNEGDPSNIIYVKNLPRKISLPALQNLYKDYPAVEYRILNGKMRGQGFMTFESVEKARTVLISSNGLIINNKFDKPIVLQFGQKGEHLS